MQESTKQSWVCRSTEQSRAAGQVSVLAVFETLTCVAVYWALLLWLGVTWHHWVIVLATPMVLLRSDQSVAMGLKWFAAYSDLDEVPSRSINGVIIALLSFLVAGLASRFLSSNWFVGPGTWILFAKAIFVAWVMINLGFAVAVAAAGPAATTGAGEVAIGVAFAASVAASIAVSGMGAGAEGLAFLSVAMVGAIAGALAGDAAQAESKKEWKPSIEVMMAGAFIGAIWAAGAGSIVGAVSGILRGDISGGIVGLAVGAVSGGIIGAIAGALAGLVVGSGIGGVALAGVGVGVGVWLRAVAVRLTATARFLVPGLGRLPQNWRFSVAVSDVFHPPELIPGDPDWTYGAKFSLWRREANMTEQENYDLALRLILIPIFFAPAMLWRWSVKSTAWFYLPLLWVSRGWLRLSEDDLIVWGKSYSSKVVNWVWLILGGVSLVLASMALFSLQKWIELQQTLSQADAPATFVSFLVSLNWAELPSQPWLWFYIPSYILTIVIFLALDGLAKDIRHGAAQQSRIGQLEKWLWAANARAVLTNIGLGIALWCFLEAVEAWDKTKVFVLGLVG